MTKKEEAATSKVNEIKTPIGNITFEADGFTYKYRPLPDISTKELSDILTLFISLTSRNAALWDTSDWLKQNNLLRHFYKA
jgi:hypothetical protein